MTSPLILVTGATGATGGAAIDQLLAKGASLRALVRKDDDRAAALRALGVDIAIGDIHDFAAVRQAMEGVYSAYFVYPLDTQILKATTYFAQAAKEAGVQAIVNISQRTAHRDSASHSAQDHWFAEQVFDWSGVPVIHLRPVLFIEWLLYPFQLPIIQGHHALMLPGGEGRHSPISVFDQGRVIATLLQDPVAHLGKTYNLYGPEEMSYGDIAKVLGKVLGRDIAYVPETLDAFEKRIAGVGVPAPLVQHLVAVFAEYQQGLLSGSNNTVEELTGVAPISIAQFVEQHRALFAS